MYTAPKIIPPLIIILPLPDSDAFLPIEHTPTKTRNKRPVEINSNCWLLSTVSRQLLFHNMENITCALAWERGVGRNASPAAHRWQHVIVKVSDTLAAPESSAVSYLTPTCVFLCRQSACTFSKVPTPARYSACTAHNKMSAARIVGDISGAK